MKNKIIYFGVLGTRKASIVGGGESGNRRTTNLLYNLGYKLTIIEKPYPIKKLHGIIYILQLIYTFVKFVIILLKNIKKSDIVHISGFYNNLVYFEFALTYSAKLLRYKVIYEIRAGGMIDMYTSYSTFYRYFFNKILHFSDVILCQGLEYINFVNNRTKKNNAYYYPNFIENKYIKELSITNRVNGKTINIIYFGRITPQKNILLILEICNLLHLRNIDFKLNLIGSVNEKYKIVLEKKIQEYNIKDKITFHPPMDFSKIYDILKNSHFFIFPSNEFREGHSNSLTEAMGCGVVPISSTAGFSSSVIKNSDLIINDFNPYNYANKIIDIWNTGKWATLSYEVYNNVINNYTENIIVKKLHNIYETLSVNHSST